MGGEEAKGHSLILLGLRSLVQLWQSAAEVATFIVESVERGSFLPLSWKAMSIPNHLIPVARRMRKMPITEPDSPWRRAGVFAIGGLTDVGFPAHSDLLLVIASSAGRSVFDCLRGEMVARDRSQGSWQDAQTLEADAIGPLAGQRVRTSGICGGGLPRLTEDGWTVEDFVLDWPDHSLLLLPPGSWVLGDAFGKRAEYVRVAVESELRAWGFSPTGRSLVLATSSDLTFWNRTVMNGSHEQTHL